MSGNVIPKNQGAVKLSEIFTDEAISSIGTVIGQEGIDVVKQTIQLALDANRKLVVFSTGRINWNGSDIQFNADDIANNIKIKIPLTDNETIRTFELTLQGSTGSNTSTTFKNISLAHNELLYIEINRQVLIDSGGSLTLENAVGGGSLIAGKTLRKVSMSSSTGMPKMSIDLNNNSDTLNIPVAFRYDWTGLSSNQDLIWAANGDRWAKDTLIPIGGSVALSQGGDIPNMIEISGNAWDGEVGAGGWSLYNDSSSTPSDGFGGTVNSNFTFGVTSTPSEILSGSASMYLQKAGSINLQGHGVSVDITIPRAYQSQRMMIRYFYRFISGAYASGDLAWSVIADFNGSPQVIAVVNGQVPVGEGEHIGWFDPIIGIDDYRLCLHQKTSSVSPYRLLLDEIKVHQNFYSEADIISSPQKAGFITTWSGDFDPDGWAICDGRALDRVTYSELFFNITTRFGQGDGVSTFNIPDLRGQFTRGTVSIADKTFLPSAINATTNVITVASHNFNRTGFPVRFTTTGALPGNLSLNTTYYIIYLTSSTFQVSGSLGGSAIDITSTGTGVHTVKQWIDPDAASRTAINTGGVTGDTTGSYESDEIASHRHWMSTATTDDRNFTGTNGNTQRYGIVADAGTYSPDDPNDSRGRYGAYSGGNETRPKNTIVNYVIKLVNDRVMSDVTTMRTEHASNSENTSIASDLSSYSYDTRGSFIPNGVTGTDYVRQIEFKSVISLTDRLQLETDFGSNGTIWALASQSFAHKKWVKTQSNLNSMIRLGVANGYGSTATKIPRFSSTLESVNASNITYTDSAADGASFTAVYTGFHSFSFTANFSAASKFAITKNCVSGDLTQLIASLTDVKVLAEGQTDSANTCETIHCRVYLLAGDIVRPHTDGASFGTGRVAFSATFEGASAQSSKQSGISLIPVVNTNTATVTFHEGGADEQETSWASYNSWRWRVTKTQGYVTTIPAPIEFNGMTGMITMYGGETDPSGWLICDGRAVSRSTYSSLYALIGVKFGRGNGTTTFNLPDFRGAFPRGTQKISDKIITGIPSSNNIVATSHGYNKSGMPVRFTSGTVATGLALNTTYYAIVVDANTLAFALTRAQAVSTSPTKITLSGSFSSANLKCMIDPDASSRVASTTGGVTGDSTGSFQDFALQNMTGNFSGLDRQGSSNAPLSSGVFATDSRWNSAIKSGSPDGWGTNVSFNASRVSQTSTETRPVNLNVNFIIKT